jgi:hypothetical protein
LGLNNNREGEFLCVLGIRGKGRCYVCRWGIVGGCWMRGLWKGALRHRGIGNCCKERYRLNHNFLILLHLLNDLTFIMMAINRIHFLLVVLFSWISFIFYADTIVNQWWIHGWLMDRVFCIWDRRCLDGFDCEWLANHQILMIVLSLMCNLFSIGEHWLLLLFRD